MKEIVTNLVALSLLCATVSCNRTVQKEMDSLKSVIESSETNPPSQALTTNEIQTSQSDEHPCKPDFDPEPTTANGCYNACQYVYEGWASTELDAIYVNCINSPTNWSLTIQEYEGQQYFQFAVLHDPIIYADFPHGAGLCSRDLIFEPLSDIDGSFPCMEYWEFIQTGEGDQNGNRAILNLWMSDDYWNCYEPGSFNFRVTVRMELPIWSS